MVHRMLKSRFARCGLFMVLVVLGDDGGKVCNGVFGEVALFSNVGEESKGLPLQALSVFCKIRNLW